MPLAMRTRTFPDSPRAAARRRRIVVATATTLLLCWCRPVIARESISASQAAKHVGETTTVCGMVASAKYVPGSKGQPTFLNLDEPYPDQPFTVVVWGDDRGRFSSPPEVAFDGKRICVTGLIETYKQKPQIVVRDPKQVVDGK